MDNKVTIAALQQQVATLNQLAEDAMVETTRVHLQLLAAVQRTEVAETEVARLREALNGLVISVVGQCVPEVGTCGRIATWYYPIDADGSDLYCNEHKHDECIPIPQNDNQALVAATAALAQAVKEGAK